MTVYLRPLILTKGPVTSYSLRGVKEVGVGGKGGGGCGGGGEFWLWDDESYLIPQKALTHFQSIISWDRV